MTKQKKQYSAKKSSQFNKWRALFQILVCKIGYMIRLKLIYRIEVNGLENVPKDNKYIVCPNHLSTLDPPMIVAIFPRPLAFMAKQELFKNVFMRWWLDWLGAFAVNRESLGVSTIKTVQGISESDWAFAMFPQGTREVPGEIKNINKGFARLAQLTKCNILPVGITGTEEVHHLPFTGKIVVNIGSPIQYSKDVDSVTKQWGEQIADLTGFTYIGNQSEENVSETNGGEE